MVLFDLYLEIKLNYRLLGLTAKWQSNRYEVSAMQQAPIRFTHFDGCKCNLPLRIRNMT